MSNKAGTVFRKTYIRQVPPNAEFITRKGVRLARWKDRKGKVQIAELTEARDGTPRVKKFASTWTAKYRDGEGVVQVVATGCRDKQAAMAVLNELLQRAELVKSKILSPDQDRIADHQTVPLSEHIEDFIEYQRNKGTHPDRVKNYDTRLAESADACGFRRLTDLSVDKLESWLSGQRTGDRKMSASVYNGYREVWLAFGNWCIGKRTSRKQTHFNGERRLLANPFDGMAKLNEKAEPRRRARALTQNELSRLLRAGQERPLREARTVRRGPNAGELLARPKPARWVKLIRLGYERSLIYKTAVLTGLRADELRTLSVSDLSFGDVPFIKLRHSNEKNRKGSTVALRSDLASDLFAWVSRLEPTARVFYVPDGLLRIMDRDIEAASIPKVDKEGRVVHVHALRHSFGTHLSLAGVAPRVAQKAMRHSDISLTMGTYTDSSLLDTASAIERLPSLPIIDAASETDAPTDAPNLGYQGELESIPVHSTDESPEGEDKEKARKTQGFTGFDAVGATRFELATSTSRT